MLNLHLGLGPEPETARLATVAARYHAELDAFLADVEGRVRVLLPAEGCLVWRSAAADGYEARLRVLGVRLGSVTTVVADACEAQGREAARLRAIADDPASYDAMGVSRWAPQVWRNHEHG
jgi:hypothetical protein